MLHQSCIFLGKRETNRDGAIKVCTENDAELAVVLNNDDAAVVDDYIRHTDVMAEKATIYVWTMNVCFYTLLHNN